MRSRSVPAWSSHRKLPRGSGTRVVPSAARTAALQGTPCSLRLRPLLLHRARWPPVRRPHAHDSLTPARGLANQSRRRALPEICRDDHANARALACDRATIAEPRRASALEAERGGLYRRALGARPASLLCRPPRLRADARRRGRRSRPAGASPRARRAPGPPSTAAIAYAERAPFARHAVASQTLAALRDRRGSTRRRPQAREESVPRRRRFPRPLAVLARLVEAHQRDRGRRAPSPSMRVAVTRLVA